MSSSPEGFSTIGPHYFPSVEKEKFRDACKIDNVTMGEQIDILVKGYIKSKFPDFYKE